MTFTDFSFDRRIVAGIASCGYAAPTPIQEQAIPLILKGHDLMGLAQTGTGKTAAFALPILQHLLTAGTAPRTPRVLVLAPTRELALQINENFTTLGRSTGIRSAVVMGGVGMEPQIRAAAASAVVIACPGRLVRLIQRGAVDLRDIHTLVLDEADRMLDMGFLPDIKRILERLPAKRQNLLFSATMPDDIRAFARKILVDPRTVQIANTAPVASVSHVFYKTQNDHKNALLEDLLSGTKYRSMLIFTRTKHKAKSLSRKLADRGYDSTFLQGNMSQNQRERALDGFRTGRFNIMVATDIAARGLDCDRITHVVNYDMPDSVETYTHRIGRTGRAGRSGSAISLVTRDDADQIQAIERVMHITIENRAGGEGRTPEEQRTATAERRPAPRTERRTPPKAERRTAPRAERPSTARADGASAPKQASRRRRHRSARAGSPAA